MSVVMSFTVGWSSSKSFTSCCPTKPFFYISIVWTKTNHECINFYQLTSSAGDQNSLDMGGELESIVSRGYHCYC